MEVKKDILWRVYLSYIVVVIICLVVFGKAFYIQQVQGAKWRSMSDSLHQKIEEVDAERGTIYSEDGQMLSTSVPKFNIYIDFAADGLREKSGVRFRENLDSLSESLAMLFKDKSIAEYKHLLQQEFKNRDRYFLLQKNISYRQYETLKQFPLVRLGKNKSGFIVEENSFRLNPYQLLAYRTIGLDRENAQKIGLEKTYDTLLKGSTGRRLVRYIAGGVSIPVDDEQIEPENGKDIVTTLDVFIQEVTENALMKMMVANEAEHGCAIVMETKTGKIKAIANLGKRQDGSYTEDFNYAINPSEPGSTFKLVTMMSLLEDKKISLNQIVNVQNGIWQTAGQTVKDDDDMVGKTNITVKQAFEFSSNVGMAKLVTMGYSKNPGQFLAHLKKFKMDTLTGIDLVGERKPVIIRPGNRLWGPTTLPWMAFGYNLQVTPLQTITLYNSVANNGTMMQPYLVNAVKDEGETIREFQPRIVDEKICSNETLKQIRQCLEGVCSEGTARKLFANSPYKVGGKTGTALVANGSSGYADEIFQSSFAGFFPAENPQYTILVVIVNKPHVVNHFGASVAGPVFKEIADRLYTNYVKQANYVNANKNIDSIGNFSYTSARQDVKQLATDLKLGYTDVGTVTDEWLNVSLNKGKLNLSTKPVSIKTMPQLKGMGLKDVVVLCENMGLKVSTKGKGRVAAQSIQPGESFAKGQILNIELN